MVLQIRNSFSIILLVHLLACCEAVDQRFLDIRNVGDAERERAYIGANGIDDVENEEDTSESYADAAAMLRRLANVYKQRTGEDVGVFDAPDKEEEANENADTAILKKLGHVHGKIAGAPEAMIESSSKDVDDVDDDEIGVKDDTAEVIRKLAHVHKTITGEDSRDAYPRDEQHEPDEMDDADTAILRKLGKVHQKLADKSEAMIETSSEGVDDDVDDQSASDIRDLGDETGTKDDTAEVIRRLAHVHRTMTGEDSGDAYPRNEQQKPDDMDDADTAILRKLGNLQEKLADTSEAMIDTSSQGVDEDVDDQSISDADGAQNEEDAGIFKQLANVRSKISGEDRGEADTPDVQMEENGDAILRKLSNLHQNLGKPGAMIQTSSKDVDDGEDDQDDKDDGAEADNILGNLASVNKIITRDAGDKHPWGKAASQQEGNEIEDAGVAILKSLHNVHNRLSDKSEGAKSRSVGSENESEEDDGDYEEGTAGDAAADVIAPTSERPAIPETDGADAGVDGSDLAQVHESLSLPAMKKELRKAVGDAHAQDAHFFKSLDSARKNIHGEDISDDDVDSILKDWDERGESTVLKNLAEIHRSLAESKADDEVFESLDRARRKIKGDEDNDADAKDVQAILKKWDRDGESAIRKKLAAVHRSVTGDKPVMLQSPSSGFGDASADDAYLLGRLDRARRAIQGQVAKEEAKEEALNKLETREMTIIEKLAAAHAKIRGDGDGDAVA